MRSGPVARSRLVVVGCATLIAALSVSTGSTWAQTTTPTTTPGDGGVGTGIHGGGTVNSGGVGAGVGAPGGTTVSSGGSGGSSSGGGGGASSQCQWQFMGSQANGNGVDPQGNVLPGAGGGLDQNGNPVSNTASGSWYLETCPGQPPVSVFVPTGAGGPAPAPPPPPGPGEVAATTPFPTESIHFNPCLGVTGLTTWFWATVGPGTVPPVAASATIRGYTVHVTAASVKYRWDITAVSDGSTATVWGSTAGSATDPPGQFTVQPSASWMPDQKGRYTVTLTVSWAGTYTFTGHGITQTSELGPVDQAPPVTRPMPVQEIRSVLVSPDSVPSPTTSTTWDPVTC
jgi:hypothetical protein